MSSVASGNVEIYIALLMNQVIVEIEDENFISSRIAEVSSFFSITVLLEVIVHRHVRIFVTFSGALKPEKRFDYLLCGFLQKRRMGNLLRLSLELTKLMSWY